MAQKQAVPINFSRGLDTKTDPKQVQLGKFLSLKNSVFTETGALKKRNGFGELAALPDSNSTYLTTFNTNLTAIGTNFQAYSEGTLSWINKGAFQPLNLSVLPTVRSPLSQIQCDSVIASNNNMCTVYTEVNNNVASYKYVVQDSVTGQNIINPTVIPITSGAITGSPRVFLLGGYFAIVFTNTITGTAHLQYVAVSTSNPLVVIPNADLVASYSPTSTLSWDGTVVNNTLYVCYNSLSGGQHVAFVSLSASLIVSASVSFSGSKATIMSVAADSQFVYAAFYDSISSTGFAIAIDQVLNKRMLATEFISSGTVNNITCTVQSGVMSIVYEIANNYSYDSSIATDYLNKVTVTLPLTVTTGIVGTTSTFIRSVGLASKGFLIDAVMYILTAYDGKSTTVAAVQPTYFLTDLLGNIIARFAYENGGGYLTLGLPQAQVIGSTVNIAYLFKDLISSVNKTQGLSNFAGVYSQTGVNLVKMEFTTIIPSVSEIGKNLNLPGGFLWAYDGQTINEQNFHIFPDSVEAAQIADVTPTGNLSSTVTPTLIKNMSSTTGIFPGMIVTDTTNPSAIPANTLVVSVDNMTQITMSAPAASTHVGDNLLFSGNVSNQQYFYQVTYEWTDAQGNIIRSAPSIPSSVTTTSGHGAVEVNIPTLRLTYKSGVKIVVYRWSVAQQTYYQVTPISAPLLNDKTVDSVSFIDIYSDSQIVGNSIIYTTGGVLENVAVPPCVATTLFDNRLWVIEAENRNLLNFTKQVIQNTPVEPSDLLSSFVAPTTGAQGSTGDLYCIFPMDDKLIMFKPDAMYYLNGVGPDNTGANSQYSEPIFITGTVGSINQRSIVMTDVGLMFQSDKGIYMLNRNLQTSYIGADVEEFNTVLINSAVCVPATTQVRFTLSTGTILMYDYYYGQWGVFEGATAISSTLYQSKHTLINSFGIVSQETPGLYMDNQNPVLLSFVSNWINLAGISGYQRIYEIGLLASYISPHKLFVQIAFDFRSPTQQSIINPTNFALNYGEDDLYGQTSPFGGPGPLEQWRVQTQTQKCQVFQISIQEVFDPSFGVNPGAGFVMSAMNCVLGIKKGYRPIKTANTVG